MLKNLPRLAVLLLFFASGSANCLNAAPAATAAPAVVPKASESAPSPVAARVNGVAIQGAVVERDVQRILAELAAKKAPPSDVVPAKIRSEVIDRLVSIELMAQAAAASKIEPGEADIQGELDKIRGQFGDAARMEAFLKEQGTTAAGMKADVRRMLTLRTWVEREVENKIVSISEAEARKYYDSHLDSFKKPESVRVRHILFRVAADAKPGIKLEQRKKCEAALGRVKRGEPFATVAAEVSEDKATAAKGGELGEYARGTVGGAFETAAFQLAKDAVSDVIETELGFHIIQVMERVAAGTVFTFQQIADELRGVMLDQARQERLKSLIDDLRKKAKIEIL